VQLRHPRLKRCVSFFKHERRRMVRRALGNFHLLKDSSDMAPKASQSARRLREPGLLTTESRQHFLRLKKEFHDEIKPCCTTERLYVDWVANSTWEILRLHRIKAELINGALLEALTNLLEQVLPADEFESSYRRDEAAEHLARQWFVDDKARAEVAVLLARLGMDEVALEAEAYRLRAKEIEGLDLMITSKTKSREDALRFIGKLRKNLGDRLRASSAEQLEQNSPPMMEARVAKNAK
jgi:hypothetical protein